MAGSKKINSDLDIQGKIILTDVPNNTGTLVTYNASSKTLSQRTNVQILSDLDLITATNIATNYYNKTNLQTSGQARVHWGNITNNPTTIALSGAATGTATTLGAGAIVIPVTALNASNLSAGTVPDARIAGTYTGFTHKVDGGNTVYTVPSIGSPTASGRTIFAAAEYRSASAVQVGAIVFTAPFIRAASVMKQIEIDGMLFSASKIIKIIINNYSTGITKRITLGDTDIQVRIGEDANNRFCIILGDVDSIWSYPHFVLSKVMLSHSVNDTYATGWSVKTETDLSGYINVYGEVAASSLATSIAGNAATATSATSAGTWTTARTFTIGNTGKTVNGSANVSWSLAEIGAQAALVTSTTATGITNAVTGNTNTYLNITQNGASPGSSTQITGTGSITVSSDAAGKLTINGVNTNTTYTGSLGITLSGTDFRPTYGTSANTVAQGNDVRINNGQTAFGWGNHAGLYAPINHTHSQYLLLTGGELSGSLFSNSVFSVTSDGSTHDPYGKISVTRGTQSNFAYYGLTRAGNVGWSLGINTDNEFIIGTGASDQSKIITSQTLRIGGLNAYHHNNKIFDTSNFNPDGKANALENATGIGLASAQNPNADNTYYPYFISTYGYIPLATRKWADDNFDKYTAWNLQTNNVQRTSMPSGSNLNLVAGENVTINYSAGGTVTINAANSGVPVNMVTTDTTQTISSVKTFTNNVISAGFVKSGGTATQVLMANGTVKDVSTIGGNNYSAGINISFNGITISVVDNPTFSGSVTAPAFYESSLKSLKKNIKEFKNSGLALVNQLDIVTFDRKDESAINKIGIIADDSPKEFLSEELDAVDLYKTVFIQAKAIQELTEEVDELKELVKQLLSRK